MSDQQVETGMTQAPRRAMTTSGQGLQLATLEDMWRFAGMVQASGLAPKDLQDQNKILIAVQLGLELGLTPMSALQGICVINGRPTVWGDTMLAVCQASPEWDEAAFEEGVIRDEKGNADLFRGYCIVRRKPNGKPVRREFSVADAKRAGLWANSKKLPWIQYPQRMLVMRARSWALRDTFADKLRGIYSREEAEDIDEPRTVEATVVSDPPIPKLSANDKLKAQLAQGQIPQQQAPASPAQMPESLDAETRQAASSTGASEPAPADDDGAITPGIDPTKIPEQMLTELFDAKTVGACNEIEAKWIGDTVSDEDAKARLSAVTQRKDEIRREKQKKAGNLLGEQVNPPHQ